MAEKGEKHPCFIDAAEPDGFLDIAGARRLFPDWCAPLFMQHPAIGLKPGICGEETLVPRRFDNLKVSCAAQLLKRILHEFVVADH